MSAPSRTWLLILAGVIAAAGCLAGTQAAVRAILTEPTTAEEARNHILTEVAPRVAGDVGAAGIRPADLGPAAIARFRELFERAGDPVLASGTAPGGPVPGATAGWVDVRLTRTADPDGTFGSVRGDPATVCLRFEAVWTATEEARYPFHEIRCPPQARVVQ